MIKLLQVEKPDKYHDCKQIMVLLGGYYQKYNFLNEKGSDHNIILNISNKEFFEGHYLKRLDP